jgi:hypothetical protein
MFPVCEMWKKSLKKNVQGIPSAEPLTNEGILHQWQGKVKVNETDPFLKLQHKMNRICIFFTI